MIISIRKKKYDRQIGSYDKSLELGNEILSSIVEFKFSHKKKHGIVKMRSKTNTIYSWEIVFSLKKYFSRKKNTFKNLLD